MIIDVEVVIVPIEECLALFVYIIEHTGLDLVERTETDKYVIVIVQYNLLAAFNDIAVEHTLIGNAFLAQCLLEIGIYAEEAFPNLLELALDLAI